MLREGLLRKACCGKVFCGEVWDIGSKWRIGIVKSLHPFKVNVDGFASLDHALEWDKVDGTEDEAKEAAESAAAPRGAAAVTVAPAAAAETRTWTKNKRSLKKMNTA